MIQYCSCRTLKRYQHGDIWAVITGGSDGIGLAIAQKLASEGFNICIVARNEEKIKRAFESIKEVKTKYIISDFSQLSTIEDYQSIA